MTPGVEAQQSAPSERVYNHPQVAVEKALRDLQAYATSRLPVLEGFVSANASTLQHFENPHYQFRVDIFPQGPSQTLVQVSAKITAWYAGADPGHSQYAVIPSNGRLEEDLLDRLSLYVEKGRLRPAGSAASPANGTPKAPVGSSGTSPGGASSSGAEAGDSNPVTRTSPNPDPSTLAAEIGAVRAERDAIELKQRRLQQQISELEANSKSQKYVANLAVIKAPQTPVFEQAEETSKVLFRADPEDEFEIMDMREGWVHIRLEKEVAAWVRGFQLQPAGEVDDADDAAVANFTTPNEEVKAFEGDWEPLKGKPVLFVFAQPARAIPEKILGQSQLEFSKHVFTQGYREATHSEQAIQGVVVVFLGARGGVVAATLADIRRWRSGALQDKQFLARCSFDPPDSFRNAPGR